MPVSPFESRFVRCSHVHVSGRRCGIRVLKPKAGGKAFCELHRGPDCMECLLMQTSFIPPKGW